MAMRIIILVIASITLSSFQERPDIDSFLKNPFDLQKFKKKKGSSNSGLVRPQDYFYKPKEKGVFFRFFLFYPRGFIYDRNENKKIYVRPSDGLEVVTYKPLGKYRDTFIDPTETPIQVTANYNDPDLPELALVGLDSITIKKKLGEPLVRKDSCYIYLHKEYGLALRVSKGVVEWLHYLRANVPLMAGSLPEEFTGLKKRKLQFERKK